MSILSNFKGSLLSKDNSVGARTIMAERFRCIMRVAFLLYLLTFSFSPFLRDFFPIIALLCLIPYYILDYKNSTLALFTGKKYFAFFYAFLIFGVVFSQNVWNSFIGVMLHSFTSVTLPFVAMECIRSVKDLRHIAYAVLLALFAQGMNGIYQYFTGFDFVANLPPKTGRLTGSFSDYRVGNYIALTLIPAASVVVFWRPKFGIWAVPMALICASPALFLMFLSYTRNAYVTLFAAFFFWVLLFRFFSWRAFAIALLGLVSLIPLLGNRISWFIVSQDGRWTLWNLALEVFKEFPFLGAGIGQYNFAFRELGLMPGMDAITIRHPHNIYLQFLCENGMIGSVCVLIFLLGIFYWGYKKLRPMVVESASQKNIVNLTEAQKIRAHWHVMALYWCGWGAFLVSGTVGHNFFQRWWLALVMAYLGVLIGALTQASRAESTED